MTLYGKSKRGFASMPKDKQKLIASKGGIAAHERGTAHEYTVEEARAAGKKGGAASWAAKQARQEQPFTKRGKGKHAN